MGIEVSTNEQDKAIAQKASVFSLGLMNLDEFGYWRHQSETLGVDAAQLGAEVVLETLREMELLNKEIDLDRFVKIGSAVIDRVHESIMIERTRG